MNFATFHTDKIIIGDTIMFDDGKEKFTIKIDDILINRTEKYDLTVIRAGEITISFKEQK